MEPKLFAQIVILMIIYVFLKNFVKCLHDSHCTKCKK